MVKENHPQESPQKESFTQQCQKAWDETYQQVEKDFETGKIEDAIDDSTLLEAIRSSINSHDKSFPFVLPTQLIAKYVNPVLNAKCLQAQLGGQGAFDARSIAHKVLVPFDQSHNRVLGGAPSPYLNNPLRTPELTLQENILQKKLNKQGWKDLCFVVEEVQKRDDPTFTASVLRQIQKEIVNRLNRTQINYAAPHRISLDKLMDLLEKFLSSPSRGDKAQAVVTALFDSIRKQFGIYTEVRRSKTNAADAETGQTADIECLDSSGSIVLAVEVKDVKLIISHITEKLDRIKTSGVTEFLFLVREGIDNPQHEDIEQIINNEFVYGQNIYVFDLLDFSEKLLALIGEQGRHEFLQSMSYTLEYYSSPYPTRREWASLLSDV